MPLSLDDQTPCEGFIRPPALSEPIPPSSFDSITEQSLGEVMTTTPAQSQRGHSDTGPSDLATLDTVLTAIQDLRREVRADQRQYVERLGIFERCVGVHQEQHDCLVAELIAMKERLERLESEHAT